MSRGTLDTVQSLSHFAYGTFTLYGRSFPTAHSAMIKALLTVLTPNYLSISVWASPRSLATTCGITFVFFSYGYLDVSVPRVSLLYAMYSHIST